MDLYEAIKKRRSIRKYRPDMVERDKIMKILDAANWAPSGMNEQGWEFLVVKGPKLDALRDLCAGVIEKRMPPKEQRTPDQQAFVQWYSTLGGAPLAVIALIDREEDPGRRRMVLESVSAAFQNMLLAATAEGLGTCWMTGPLANEVGLHSILQVGEEKEIVAVTPLGYPDQSPPAPPRKDPALSTKVRWIGF